MGACIPSGTPLRLRRTDVGFPCYILWVSRDDGHSSIDDIIELYKRDVDRTLLRENLKRTPTQRVRALMELQRLAEEASRAGRRARQRD